MISWQFKTDDKQYNSYTVYVYIYIIDIYQFSSHTTASSKSRISQFHHVVSEPKNQHSVRVADHPATEREPEAHVGRVEKG